MDKKPSTLSKITKIFVWLMLLIIIGGVVFAAVASIA
ncbi:DUF4044 domain-containing protein [Lactobacillus sp. YT155]|nr:DUF4044 domain-containing protein [Lactobacillus sp. YT155]MDO1605261.1 DUF4044 domain-containing protein [Lactobacillus sp. YT155]